MEPEIRRYSSFREIEGYIIPVFQRRLDLNVAKEIAFHIKDQRNNNSYPYLGCIEIVNYDGNNYIIDGQHRYEAYRLDYEKYGRETLITVMKHTVFTYKQMVTIFQLRNMGQEVPKYILLCDNEEERQLMMKIEEYMLEQQGVVKGQARRPNVSILEFMNDISKEDVLYKYDIRNMDEFIQFLKRKNDEIEFACKNQKFISKNKISETMLAKAEKFELFIGLLQKEFWFEF